MPATRARCDSMIGDSTPCRLVASGSVEAESRGQKPSDLRTFGLHSYCQPYLSPGLISSAHVTTSPIIPEHILRFLNSLPVTGDPVQWISTFREELRLLLGDVDRVGINININCDLQNPEGYRPG